MTLYANHPELLLVTLLWGGATLRRIYQQMQFYQIEEYKSDRYLLWLQKTPTRWLPVHAVIAAVVCAGIAALFADQALLAALAGLISAGIALIPPSRAEVKKPFKRTPRATRILATAFILAGVALIALALISPVSPAVWAILGGVAVFMLAPVWLMLANVLMIPVESYFRRRFVNNAKQVLAQIQPKVIGITGSYGKTTTKNFITSLLNGRYRAYATPKSYNTMMGICLAINNDLTDNYAIDYFVVEMGAYVRGEIAEICALTPPDISVIVEVGPQHLERFGSLENTAEAKYEIIKALKPDGVAIFNWDNPHVREMYTRGYPKTRIAVSKTLAPDADVADKPRLIASEISETLSGLQFMVTDTYTGDSELFSTPVIGEHNVTNILLAAAIALNEGMKLRDIAFMVRTLQPAESRLVRQSTAQGITIINDAYSANPAGMVSALKVLALHTTGRRLLITPGMVELGAVQDAENHKLGILAADAATDVILVGAAQTRPIYDGLREANFPADRLQVVETLTEAITWYQTQLRAGDAVLFLNDLPDTY